MFKLRPLRSLLGFIYQYSWNSRSNFQNRKKVNWKYFFLPFKFFVYITRNTPQLGIDLSKTLHFSIKSLLPSALDRSDCRMQQLLTLICLIGTLSVSGKAINNKKINIEKKQINKNITCKNGFIYYEFYTFIDFVTMTLKLYFL